MGIFAVNVNIFFLIYSYCIMFVEDEEIEEQTPSSFFNQVFLYSFFLR